MIKVIKLCIVTLTIFVGQELLAQTFELKTHTLNNGGGTATSASFSINTSIGGIGGNAASLSFQLSTGFQSTSSTSIPGLIAHYPFDGNLDDVSGNMYHATIAGTQYYDNDVSGLEGRSFYFDGATQVLHNLVTPINFTGATLSAWVYLDDPTDMSGNYQHIIGLESANQFLQLASIDGTYVLYHEDKIGGTDLSFGASTFGDTEEGWHHVVITWEGTTIAGYVDGVQIGTDDTGFNLSFDVYTFTIGKDIFYSNFDGEPISGAIDEVRIYNYGLTELEVSDLFYAYPPPPTAPQNLAATVVGPGSIKLTWDDGPDETYYYVYWDDQVVSEYGEAGLEADETSYTITGLLPGTEYYIEVDAGHDYYGHDDGSDYAATVVYQTPVDLATPVAESSIPLFSMDEEITITYYPDRSYPLGELVGAGKVYMHAGLIAPESVEAGAWSYTVGNWGADDTIGEMTFNGSDAWTITFIPRDYFGDAPADFTPAQLAMVFRNADGTLVGKDANEEDIKLEIFDDKTFAPINGFTVTTTGTNTTDIRLEDIGAATPSNIQIENKEAFTIEALVNYNQDDPTGDGFYYTLVGRRSYDAINETYETVNGLVYYNDAGVSAPAGYALGSSFFYPSVSDIPYTKDTWTHIAFVFNGVNIGAYVNGIIQDVFEVTDVFEPAEMLQMGSFNGALDELRIWDYARSQEQIRRNIRKEVDPATGGLLAYWTMNETIDDGLGNEVIPDQTTGGNDLFITNGMIEQQPDLEITAFSAPSALAPGEEISTTYMIENIGGADAEPFSIGLFLSSDPVYDGTDISLASVDYTELLAGSSATGNLTGTIDAATASGNYYVIVVADFNNETSETIKTNNSLLSQINIDPANANHIAEDIYLDNYSFYENSDPGVSISTLYNDDPDNDNFTYSLVNESGFPDNSLFNILGDELRANATFNFELDQTSFSINIQVTDDRKGTYTENIILTLLDVNEAPTAITLDNASIQPGTYFNEAVGNFSTEDEDDGEIFIYSLVEDNSGLFNVTSEGQLTINGNITGSTTSYTIRVSSTDQGGSGFTMDETFIIVVGQPPTGILLSNNKINESHGSDAEIGIFTTIDPDSQNFTYNLTNSSDGKFSVGQSDGILRQVEDNLPADNYSIIVMSTDNNGLSIQKGFTISVISNAVQTTGILSFGDQQGNYRIVGIPFKSAPVSGTFKDLGEQKFDWRILSYTYQDNKVTDLTASSSMSGGVGYWFIAKNKEVTIELGAGDLNNQNIFSKSLTAGWNLIANPFLGSLDFGSVITYNISKGNMVEGDIKNNKVYTYQGGFNQTSDLAVMEGGFVWAEKSLTLAIPSATISTGSRVVEENKISSSYYEQPDEWQLFLDLKSAEKRSNITGIGINSNASELMDQYDIAPPPSFNLPLQLTEKETGLTKNVKANEETVVWDYQLTGADEMTTISWDQSISGYLDKPLMIALLPQGTVIDMRTAGEISFKPDENQSVMVIYGTELPQELISGSISAYPNPVDQEVSFRFYVDGEGVTGTSVDIFNLSGQQLGTLQQNVLGSTWAEVKYDVTSQEYLKPGVYLFKVKYRDFESIAKKLIVK